MPRPLFSERFQPIVPWVEDNVYLEPTSAIPGRIQLHGWQVPILEAYENPKVKRIVLMCSSQIGKSVVMNCICGYHIGVSPKNIMLVQPGIKVLNRFRKEKFEPMLRYSPMLNSRVHKTKVGTIPQDIIPYDGGQIFTAYAGSPASLRSLSVPVVIVDECDTYEGNQDTANPLSIIWQRTQGFGEAAKMVVASTPVGSGSSIIEQEWNSSSQGYWYLPCPHCALAQPLLWENVRELKLYCRGCAAEISERQRMSMLMTEHGYYYEEQPNEEIKGFHVNQLYSTTKTLASTAAEYNENNPRGFWTQVLGLPYRSLVDDFLTHNQVEDIYTEKWDIGEGEIGYKDADAITGSVDIHKNRLEVMIEMWVKRVSRTELLVRIPLKEDNPAPAYRALDRILREWQPDMTFVDRHYPSPDDVNYYAQKHLMHWISSGRMWLIVGTEHSFNKPLISKWPTGQDPYYGSVSSDTGKEWVHNMVRYKSTSVNRRQVPKDFAEQMCSEELRWTSTQGGTERKKWVKTHRLNEALDLKVYSTCAREALGIDFSRQQRLTWKDLQEL